MLRTTSRIAAAAPHRTEFDFDVIGGPSAPPRPAPAPRPAPPAPAGEAVLPAAGPRPPGH